jgi:hypothetical protein
MSGKKTREWADSPAAEAQGRELLNIQWARLKALEDIPGSLVALPGGELAADDDATGTYNPISHQLIFALSLAMDHLRTLRTFVEAPNGGIPALAGYTLVRSALESACLGIWLVSGGNRNRRVFCSLHLSATNLRDMKRLIITDPTSVEKDLRRLEEIKATRPANNQKRLDRPFPKTNEIVRAAARKCEHGTNHALTVWQACSSIAHANNIVSVNMLERTRREGGTPQNAQYDLTSSVLTLARFLEIALDYVEYLVERFRARSETPELGLRGGSVR